MPDKIKVICDLGSDASKWVPAGLEELEQGRRTANAIADSYTEDDWRYYLNALKASSLIECQRSHHRRIAHKTDRTEGGRRLRSSTWSSTTRSGRHGTVTTTMGVKSDHAQRGSLQVR